MNHEAMSISHQRGAVLAFSLVMLLLLTLVSVSMIQHNKQELAMTGNTLQQTKTLASAESELAQAQQLIDTTRLNPANLTDHTCNSNPLKKFTENQVFFNPATAIGTATITAVYCLDASKSQTQCTFTNGVPDPIAACMCSGGTEIYTVKWVSTADINYGSQRTVESNYAVDCSAGQF
jgi:Tfp pilus assembly protein PilX